MNNVESLAIRSVDGGSAVSVKVVPGSSRDRLVGVLGPCLKISTSAAPEKGKANAAVAALLADALEIDPRRIELLAGQTSPRKEFLIVGMDAQELRDSLAKL